MKTLISWSEIGELQKTKRDFAYEIFERVHAYIYAPGIADSLACLKQLPIGYQTIYSTFVAEGEICNGGFYQYYGNSTAQDFNDLATAGFSRIGATTTAAILRLAFGEILSQSPTFRNEYQTIGIQDAFNKATDIYDEIDIDFDDNFYTALDSDDVTQRRFDYVLNNYSDFVAVP